MYQDALWDRTRTRLRRSVLYVMRGVLNATVQVWTNAPNAPRILTTDHTTKTQCPTNA